MKLSCVLVVAFALAALAEDLNENTGVRLALKIYDDCNKADSFSPCLKKKAITFLSRLSRMDKLVITDGITLVRSAESSPETSTITEEQLDTALPRSIESKDQVLSNMLWDKASKFISSRSLEVSLPKVTDLSLVEGRGKKMKGMMGGMMMGIAAKMAALIPIAIAGLFMLAGKALIVSKIALLLSSIIAIKKLFGMKQNSGHSHGSSSGWQSSGSGGGWDKRSFDDAQNLAYKAYSP